MEVSCHWSCRACRRARRHGSESGGGATAQWMSHVSMDGRGLECALRYHLGMVSRPIAVTSRRGVRFARTALLWLALVLALAQVIAIRHAYTHVTGETTSQSGGKHPGGLAHCDACIAAVALGGAAPPPAALLIAAPAQQLPHLIAATAYSIAPRQHPYAIRAPPAIAS